MTDIILLSDPRVAATRVTDNGEALVDAREFAALRVDTRKSDDAGSYAHLRADVLRRLLLAQEALPPGVRLLMVEGFRPPALQRRYFEEYAAALRLAHPDVGPDRIRELASAYISPPEVAPHVSGGAVDLTLCTDDGVELPLGTEVNATPEESAGGCRTGALNIDAEARAHRAALGRAMTAAGFVNYPTEWWHWSYGDRYWALLTEAPAAKYGLATLSPTTV
ncbi:M15 family metallopeptidase [Streptomyces sp. TLI_55]|uniref:M15 family metallopeptidase n=1 Tax=Streptomyces sp. TLI_55 TaxID=1938861 RepID=UPI000BE22E2E|nr:M15 family metallopeptidase [Streptomyces sp. TLI_55]